MNKIEFTEKIPQQLETERLILRQMTLDDTQAIYKHFSDDDVTRYMDIASLKSTKEAEEIIQYYLDRVDKQECYRWAIIRKSDKSFLGTCGFNSWIKHRGSRSEIGYDLSKEYWGQGYMSEALKVLIQYGFEKMELNRIEALVLLDATRSVNVLTKLGFTKEGILRQYGYWKGQFWDEYIFSLLREDWVKW